MSLINTNPYYYCNTCGKNFKWWQNNPGIRKVCGMDHETWICCHIHEEEVPDVNVVSVNSLD